MPGNKTHIKEKPRKQRKDKKNGKRGKRKEEVIGDKEDFEKVKEQEKIRYTNRRKKGNSLYKERQ